MVTDIRSSFIPTKKLLLLGLYTVLSIWLSFYLSLGIVGKLAMMVYGNIDKAFIDAPLYLTTSLLITFVLIIFLTRNNINEVAKYGTEEDSVFEAVAKFTLPKCTKSVMVAKLIVAVLLFLFFYFRNGFFERWMFIPSNSICAMILVALKNFVAQSGALLFFTIICNCKLVNYKTFTAKAQSGMWLFLGLVPICITFPFFSMDPFYAPALLFSYCLLSSKFYYLENLIVHFFAVVILPIIATLALAF